jgi:hypothetical protein
MAAADGIKVRAVTRFVVLKPDPTSWEKAIAAAASLTTRLASTYKALGYAATPSANHILWLI